MGAPKGALNVGQQLNRESQSSILSNDFNIMNNLDDWGDIVPSSPPNTELENPVALRDDYIHFPAMHFEHREDRDREILRVETDIKKMVGGADLLRMITDGEKRDAAPEIWRTIEAVKRGVQAIRNAKQFIAASRIVWFLRRRIMAVELKRLRDLRQEETDLLNEAFRSPFEDEFCALYAMNPWTPNPLF